MRVVTGQGTFELGVTETTATISITDYSRRVTDDFGVTTIVERGFSRSLSVRMALPFEAVDSVQQLLADLRATPAQWIADDRFQWLRVNGFYKDFEIDLSVQPISFCTLSVEGLAETEAVTDDRSDPAPDGAGSSLMLLQPVRLTDAMLVSSSVAENDAPLWDAGATYAARARVIAGHRIFESLVEANTGNAPDTASVAWMDVGPTNRWAMFDEALGTVTTAAGAVSVTIDAGAAEAVALLDVTATSVRVQGPGGYDRVQVAGSGAITFLDLPGTPGAIMVTVTGDQVAIGTLLIGRLDGLGITEASPTAAITDYSRKEVDDFGEVTVVQRAWAKRMAARALIRTDAIDLVANRIAAVRARPSLWIGQAGVDAITIYGFFKDFSIEVGPSVAKLSLSVEGLSRAAATSSRLSGPLSFTVGARGNAAVPPMRYLHGLRRADGEPIFTNYARSYSVAVYNPNTGVWIGRSFDVFGNGEVDHGFGGGANSNAAAMAAYLNAIPVGYPVVVYSSDEPASGRTDALKAAMYRCGASAGRFGGELAYRSAYVLVGSAGAGEGNSAIEIALPETGDSDPDAWILTTFSIVNGVVALGGSGRDGQDGRDGTDGLPGADGADGQTSYIHYAYANSPDGQVDFITGAPGNRAFEGVYADFVEADSGNPAAYTWREYKGPPFGMATRGTAIVAGNQVIKGEGGAADWDADAYSTVGFRGSAKMSCRFAAGSYAMAGLNTDPTADTSYTSIDFAWYYQPEQNVMYAFESGVNAASLGTYDPSANYAIEYDGVTVTYTANGVPKRQVYVGPDRTYYFDSSFLLATSRITDIEFKAGSQRPAGLTLIPQTGATITSASSVRIYGFNGGWGAGKCYSRERYGQGAVAEWTIPHPGNMDAVAGLAQGIGDASYAGITFGLYVDNAGRSFAFVNGSESAAGPTVPLDQPVRCKVAYDGKRWVRWYVNQAQIFVYDWGEQPDELMFAAALASTDPTLTEIAFSKAGANGRDGNDGAPGERGADGLTSYVHFAYANSPDGLVDFTTGAPAGHAFIGTYTDFTAADSANPASYSWIAYKGPANFGLAASGAAVVASNSLIMTSGGGWGAAGGYSTEGFRGGASASFKFPVPHSVMAGLNTDPTADNSYGGIDYAFHQSADGNVYIYESGTGIYTGYPFDPNRLYQIVYNGKTVRYTIDGLQLREIPAPPNLTLFFDAALADGPPSRVTNIAFASAGQAGADGAPGANGADGTDGVDGFIVDTETPVFVIPVYSSGAIKPGWSGGVGTIKLTKGGVVIPASSYSVANNQDVTGLALAGNQFSFTGLADDAGQFDVRAVYNGQTYSRTITVKKVYDGEAAYKESASTSGTMSAGPLPITGATVVPSARGCTVSSTFSYVNSAPGSFVQWRGSLSIYWRNITDNGPWNLLETAIGSTASVVNVGTAQEPEYQYTNGSVSAAADFPAPVGDKEIGFEARLSRDVGSGSVNARGGVKLEVRS